MNDLERTLAEITPRAAAVTLLLFDHIIIQYERDKGIVLSEEEKRTVQRVLRFVLTQECQA
jgi:hypothetical protein